jgi:hypothetical protein
MFFFLSRFCPGVGTLGALVALAFIISGMSSYEEQKIRTGTGLLYLSFAVLGGTTEIGKIWRYYRLHQPFSWWGHKGRLTLTLAINLSLMVVVTGIVFANRGLGFELQEA